MNRLHLLARCVSRKAGAGLFTELFALALTLLRCPGAKVLMGMQPAWGDFSWNQANTSDPTAWEKMFEALNKLGIRKIYQEMDSAFAPAFCAVPVNRDGRIPARRHARMGIAAKRKEQDSMSSPSCWSC